MDVLIERCAGLDVHKRTVVATVRSPGATGTRRSVTQAFATTAAGLQALEQWLTTERVSHVAMESTGCTGAPWMRCSKRPLEVCLVNPRAVKHVPGRKTDVRDSEWLAQLLECGLLKASFIPPPLIRDLRDLTRYRKVLVRERGHHVATLNEAAWSASRVKRSYYHGLYHRVKARQGPKKAIGAVQHAMLRAIWYILTRGVPHDDLGADYFATPDAARTQRHHVRQL